MEVLFAEFAIFVDIVKSEKELYLSLSVVELCYCTGTYRTKCGEQCCKLKVKIFCLLLKLKLKPHR